MPTQARSTYLVAALFAYGALALAPALAAEPGQAPSAIKRTEVHRADVAAPGYEAVVMKVELAAGARAGRHSHPGDEISYVTDGETTLLVDGEPPRKLKAGDAFVVKAGKVHDAVNDGEQPVHLVGVYVIEKGQPLATPAK
jgi:quercetin dioxygenase-like cupin family protein